MDKITGHRASCTCKKDEIYKFHSTDTKHWNHGNQSICNTRFIFIYSYVPRYTEEYGNS